MSKAVGALVLAAGKATRMGRSKLSLPWEDTTILGSVLRALQTPSVSRVFVVTGAYRDEVDQIVKDFEGAVETVFNPVFENGEMTDSIKIGMAVVTDVEGVLVVLGDQPQITKEVVEALCERFSASDSPLWVPSYAQRRGHPWLIGKELWSELTALNSSFTLRDFLNAHSHSIHYINFKDQGIVNDIDTWEDYLRAVGETDPNDSQKAV